MTPLTDEELLALITDMESDRVERKRAWKGDAPEKGRQAVRAFANDLPNHGKPGALFIGVEDSGAPTGMDFVVTDELLQTLADIKTDGKITPPPTMTVAKRHLLGRDVAVVTVCGPPMHRQCVWRGASGFAPGHGVRRHRRRTSVC